MKFSILIPVYNVEKYLQQCFDSVINQTFSDYEVIVVDDGSTDGSPEICEAFAENYPERVVVVHTENKGLIAARRLAIEKAQGEFCVFVDSDDYIEHNLLDTVNQYFQKEEDIDVVIYSFFYCNQQKRVKQQSLLCDSTVWEGRNKKELYELLVTGDTIDALWIKAIKTELLKKDPIEYQKYYRNNMSEDVLQSLYPLTFARKVIFADVPLYNYRYNHESIARNFNSGTILKKNSSHVFEEVMKIIPMWDLDNTDIYKKVYARWFSDVMYIFWKSCEAAKHKEDWTTIFATAWHEMLPDLDVSEYEDFVNVRYLNLYNNYINDSFFRIRIQFFKKNMYKKIRDFKKSLF